MVYQTTRVVVSEYRGTCFRGPYNKDAQLYKGGSSRKPSSGFACIMETKPRCPTQLFELWGSEWQAPCRVMHTVAYSRWLTQDSQLDVWPDSVKSQECAAPTCLLLHQFSSRACLQPALRCKPKLFDARSHLQKKEA